MEIYKTAGFTILELIIIIIILGIVSLTAFIKTPGLSVNLDTQTEQLANDIRYTQNLSMAKNQRYRIVFGSTNYAVKDAAGNNIDDGVTLESGTTLSLNPTPTNSTIIFSSKGTPYDGNNTTVLNNTTIYLTSGEATSSISITTVTGRVQVTKS